jgi:hypothetical protein
MVAEKGGQSASMVEPRRRTSLVISLPHARARRREREREEERREGGRTGLTGGEGGREGGREAIQLLTVVA